MQFPAPAFLTAMHRLRVMLEYFHPWPDSAGFYLARERGWYAEHGMELALLLPDPWRGDSLAHLLRGDCDFAVFPSNRLLVRRAGGAPTWRHQTRWSQMRQPLLQGYAQWLAQHGVLSDAETRHGAADARFLAETAT